MKHFIDIENCSNDQISELVNRSIYWKNKINNKNNNYNKILTNLVIAMVFEKASTRTRVAFEVAIARLGGRGIFLSKQDLQLSRGELIEDTARVLGGYLDGLILRTHDHEGIKEYVECGGIPVINALSNREHPCQAIADLVTMKEVFGEFGSRKVVYVGCYNNVAHSLMMGCLKMGMSFSLVCPEDGRFTEGVIDGAKKVALENGGDFYCGGDIAVGVEGADVVYTDVWKSMGDVGEVDLGVMGKYQVNKELLGHGRCGVRVMHCLPARRGEEITGEVFDHYSEMIFLQAENKCYAHMGILDYIFNNNLSSG